MAVTTITKICEACKAEFTRCMAQASQRFCSNSCKFSAAVKHGAFQNGKPSPELSCWYAMRKRCMNKNAPMFYRYGGRGISVCQEWKDSFSAFLRDMGPRPSLKHTVDRINNDGNYEPSNCRWATPKEQRSNNSQKIIRVTYLGETLCLSDWSIKTGLQKGTLQQRWHKGQRGEELFLPPRNGNRKGK